MSGTPPSAVSLPFPRWLQERSFLSGLAALLAFMAVLGVVLHHNYLLFHLSVELFAVAVSMTVFVIAWNTRGTNQSPFLAFVGLSMPGMALLDLVHAIAFPGMNVIGPGNPNLSTQLWIAARGLQAAVFLAAPLLTEPRLRTGDVLLIQAAAVACAAAGWWGTRQFLPAFDDSPTGATGSTGRARSAWLEPRTLLIGLMVLAAAFAEGTANDWMAVAFVDGHQLDNALGVVALAVFLSFMTAGRILGTGLLNRYGRVLVLRAMFAAAVLGCLLVVFGNPVVAFIGAAIWGVGASLGFPVGMSAAADDPVRAPLRISVVATIGYLAFLAGPPLLGLLGDHFGVLRALLVVGAVSVLALLVTPAAREPEPAAVD